MHHGPHGRHVYGVVGGTGGGGAEGGGDSGGLEGGGGGKGTKHAVCTGSVHGTPALRMVPLQHCELPPGKPLQPSPPHVPHELAQQTSSACMPVAHREPGAKGGGGDDGGGAGGGAGGGEGGGGKGGLVSK